MKILALACLMFALLVLGCVGGKNTSEKYRVTYDVIGDGTQRASVTYTNSQGGTEQADNVELPWSKTFTVHYGDFLYISAQNKSESGSITARITIGERIRKDSTSSGGFVIATADYRCCD